MKEKPHSRLRKRSLGSICIRTGRLIWQPSDYAKDYLNLTEDVDCGKVGDPDSEKAIDDAFRRAHQLRKSFRGQRKLEKATLTDAEYRARRNQEVERRIIAMARRREAEAA
jgi:hypothetical protein